MKLYTYCFRDMGIPNVGKMGGPGVRSTAMFLLLGLRPGDY